MTNILLVIYILSLVGLGTFGFLGYKPKYWFHPQVAPAAVLATVLPLFMLDSVLNYMFNPLFPLISGGLSALMLKPPERLDGKPSKSGKVKGNTPVKRVKKVIKITQVKLNSRSSQKSVTKKARTRRVTINNSRRKTK